MYGMTPWKDEVVQYPYRYKETQNADGTVEHEPSRLRGSRYRDAGGNPAECNQFQPHGKRNP